MEGSRISRLCVLTMCQSVTVAVYLAFPPVVFIFIAFFTEWSTNTLDLYTMSPWWLGGFSPKNHLNLYYGYPEQFNADITSREGFCKWAAYFIEISETPMHNDPWCGSRAGIAGLFAVLSWFISIFNVYSTYQIYKKRWDPLKAYWNVVFGALGAITGIISMSAWLTIESDYRSYFGVDTSDQGCISMCLTAGSGIGLIATSWVLSLLLAPFSMMIARQKKLVSVNTFTDLVRRGDLGGALAVLSVHEDLDLAALSSDGRTGLHWAAALNHLDLAISLLRANCPPDTRDSDGWAAMHWACRMGHAGVVLALIEGGANMNVKERQGQTPLMLAVVSNAADCVEVLADKGADLDIRSVVGETALMYCAQQGAQRRRMAAMLIALGADTSKRNAAGETVLHYAASADDAGNAEEVLELAEHPWHLYVLTDSQGATALDVARIYKKKRVLRYLRRWEAQFCEAQGWNKKPGEGLEAAVERGLTLPTLSAGFDMGKFMANARKQAPHPTEEDNHGADEHADADETTARAQKHEDGGGGQEAGGATMKPRPPKVQKQPSFFSPAPVETDKKWL